MADEAARAMNEAATKEMNLRIDVPTFRGRLVEALITLVPTTAGGMGSKKVSGQ